MTPRHPSGGRSPSAILGSPFVLPLDLGKNGKGQLKFKPSLSSSEAVVVRYEVPFGLNVENKGGRAICTKDGPGGERAGDILSACKRRALAGGTAASGARAPRPRSPSHPPSLALAHPPPSPPPCRSAGYTTYFSMQLPGGEGVVDTVASFGGMLKWKIGLFDLSKAESWDEVVDKLTSNTPERTDEVVLVFERPSDV